MAGMNVTLELPAGGKRRVEIPDDVALRDLMLEIVTVLDLPTTDANGEALNYRLNYYQVSKSNGKIVNRARALPWDQTLQAAGVRAKDRLKLTADLTAGAGSSVSDSPRVRRLRADQERIMELSARSDLIDVKPMGATRGMPPERYIVTYTVNSVIGIDHAGKPIIGNRHQVEIYLHNDYPQRWPGLKWLTPIWHPNINHVNGSVCIDAAWWGAARSLDRLVIMMGEMLEYKNFHDDPKTPPFPWDKEAAAWCREYRKKHPDFVPTDQRELLRPERVKLQKPKAASASKPRVKLK